MIILIIFILLFTLFFLFSKRKNYIVWSSALHIIGIGFCLISSILFIFKFSNYPYMYSIDYKLYLFLLKCSFSLSEIRIIFSTGMTCCLLGNLFFSFLFTHKKNKILFFCMMLFPIILYAVLNLPVVNHIFYIYMHTTKNFFIKEILCKMDYICFAYSKLISITYSIIPILICIKKFFSTKIFVSKQSTIIAIICILLLNSNIYVLWFGKMESVFFLTFQNFPKSANNVTMNILYPTLFAFLASLVMVLIALFNPFKHFSITSKKARTIKNNVSNENLRYFFHTQKNILVAISKFSQTQNLENSSIEQLIKNLNTINKLANNSVYSITKSLDMFKNIKLIPCRIKIVDVINEALEEVQINDNILVSKNYNNCNLKCDIDYDAIKECFINLINNSCEAISSQRNKDGLIQISIYNDFDLLCIEFEDNGCGIPLHNMKHIFNPLFSTKATTKNYGIGLSYCKKIISLHNGYIKVKNTKPHGLKVQIILPYKKERC